MPSSHRHADSAEVPSVTSYGQVIEYIKGTPLPFLNPSDGSIGPFRGQLTEVGVLANMETIQYTDRLYLASYTLPPDENTPFPYSTKPQRSPHKRSSKAPSGPQAAQSVRPAQAPFYFSIDKSLLYNAFHADFGPLHVGHLYRFAVHLHEVLGHPDTEDRPVVFWSNADSRSRANAACILATYMVLIQSWPPHLALAPISQMDPPCMPFRDAGYSQADYALTVQDVVYGVWKAREENLIGLKEFSLEEYEKYERVDMGDFNWITPSFLAFASPQHQPTHVIPPNDPLYSILPKSVAAVDRDRNLPTPFKNVLSHFAERDIGLVVRLNSELYSPSYFTALGIKHLDMIFDDGTCPPLSLVRKFVDLAHSTIAKRKGIAVHCKAGLGRTGCLIGAYLVYRYGFTANEVIAFMRFMRPGMVVGPQQHWLHLNQGTFREWWFEDTVKEKLLANLQPATPTRLNRSSSKRLASNGQTFTPPNADRHSTNTPRRAALGEITNNEQAPSVNNGTEYTSGDDMKRSVGVADENLPAPTPGQPRKTSKIYGGARRVMTENQPFDIRPDTEIVSMQRSTTSVPAGQSRAEDSCSDAEDDGALLGILSSRKSNQQSPLGRHLGSSGKQRRAISCTTTTTTTTKWDGLTSAENSDAENMLPVAVAGQLAASSPSRPKTPSHKSGNGIGTLNVGKRSSPLRRSTEGKTNVRKTSGRVGSVGAQPVNRAHKSS